MVTVSTTMPAAQLTLFSTEAMAPRCGAEEISRLRAAALSCQACPLAKLRRNVVFGRGKADRPALAIVGEAPGEDEDQRGAPFIGRSGQLLDKMIAGMGLDREKLYILNSVCCFPEGTVVSHPKVEKAFKRYYEGELLSVRSRRHKFSCTPNHPILTQRGFVAARLLVEGDHLVCGSFPQGSTFADPHVDGRPATIDQVFDSLSYSGTGERIRGTHVDFHGDGIESEIQVVGPNGFLGLEEKASVLQHLAEIILEGALFLERAFPCFSACTRGTHDPLLGDLCPSYSCVSSAGQLLPPLWAQACQARNKCRTPRTVQASFLEDAGEALCSILGLKDFASLTSLVPAHSLFDVEVPGTGAGGSVTHERLSFVGGQAIPTHAHSLRPASLVVAEKPTDGVSAYAEQLPKLFDLGSGQVELDQLIGIDTFNFSGHVYNLQTSVGWYTANGVLVSNCRPTDNRTPLPEELSACHPFLVGQLRAVQPRVILAMGAVAGKALTGSKNGVGALRGRWHDFEGTPLLVTFHPAYLLRNPAEKVGAWEDLKLVMIRLGLRPPALPVAAVTRTEQ